MAQLIEIKHGTYYAYKRQLCRCPKCKDANAKYSRDKKANYRSAAASSATAPSVSDLPAFLQAVTHGLSTTYDWYGCRCEACKEANTDRKRSERDLRVLA